MPRHQRHDMPTLVKPSHQRPQCVERLACDKGLHHEHAHAMVQGIMAWTESHHGGDDSPQGASPCSNATDSEKARNSQR